LFPLAIAGTIEYHVEAVNIETDMNEPDSPARVNRREAILRAAEEVFSAQGYEAATTLRIASAARTSKRALYELFGSKGDILAALIGRRAREMGAGVDLGTPVGRAQALATLEGFGRAFLTRLFEPSTVMTYRLAIDRSTHGEILGRTLLEAAHAPILEAVRAFLRRAEAAGALRFAEVEEASDLFFELLIGQRLIELLLGDEAPVTAAECAMRARRATEVLARLSA